MSKIKRKSLSKLNRMAVYNKCNGHCAYCGCELLYKDMQVDHVMAVYMSELNGENVDNNVDNLLPACRACNFYKGAMGIEQFREALQSLSTRLNKYFIFKLALKYNIVNLNLKHIVFYYETMNHVEQDVKKMDGGWICE